MIENLKKIQFDVLIPSML